MEWHFLTMRTRNFEFQDHIDSRKRTAESLKRFPASSDPSTSRNISVLLLFFSNRKT